MIYLFGYRGCGKTYYVNIKCVKRICILIHGRFNWYFNLTGHERREEITSIYNKIFFDKESKK